MKSNTFFAAGCMLLAMAVFIGCQEKEEKPEEKEQVPHTLVVSSESTASVPEEGGQFVIKVESNTEWHVTSSASWAVPSKTTGYGTDNVTVNISTNKVPSARTAIITVSDCMDYNWDGVINEEDLRPGDIGFVNYEIRQNAAEIKRPVADIFEWEIDKDGNVTDLSSSKLETTFVPNANMTFQMNSKTGKYDAWFSPVNKNNADIDPGSTATYGFYAAKYEDRPEVLENIANGFSMEVFLCPGVDHTVDSEVKPFSAMQTGGFGFCFRKSSAGGCIAWQIKTGPAGSTAWQRAESDIVAKKDTWYHLVGVYNKDEQTVKLYVNGKLVSSAGAPGNYEAAVEKAGYIIVGGDPAANNGASAQSAFKGYIAVARMYGEPIAAEQVDLLYKELK